ncbi:6-phosphogluconolactonase [Baekduia soli]|uniref:6-phosphogluconolactonase n=1 Tax=Baekduia soli TaxID=496014 RepID=A0A5B8U437_9ACTN|nr:6-phosphogluconolactonase [Baekduia soli]QEC47655.1 6-phosphogluconolactonase [Baekduia soli]
MPVQLSRQADAESLARHAARDLATAIAHARAERGVAHVGLAGGSTPMRCYELMDGQLSDWTEVHLWYGDERCVPFDDPESNHGQVKDRLRARGATWHPMPATLGPAEGAIEYSRELGDTVLDIIQLGMGPDGHTASLFPDHPVLDAHGVAAGVTDSPKPPPQRITLTLPKINSSRRIVLLAAGEGKSEALTRAMGPPDRRTPASLLDRTKLLIMADASVLPD